MTDLLRVHISDHVDHLLENYSGVLFVEIPVLFQTLEELASFAVAKLSLQKLLLDQIQIFIVFEDLVQFYYVGMVQFSENLDLRLKSLWIFYIFFRNNLDHSVFVGSFDHSS